MAFETAETRLLVDYLDVCNEILDRLLSETDRGAEVAVAERILANREIGLLLYDSDPDNPCCRFTVRFTDGRFQLTGKGNGGSGMEWALRRERLEQIVRDRRQYTRHPDHLDWNCLISRLGIKAPETETASCPLPGDSQQCEDLKREYDRLVEALEEIKDSNSELVNSTKLACLTNFVAGIAHEINNPIGVVKSTADSSQLAIDKVTAALESGKTIDQLREDRRFRTYLQVLRDNVKVTQSASDRIATIVRSLKTFSSLDQADCQRIDIHTGIDSSLEILGHRLRDSITVVRQYGELPRITCYPNQLNQVFMNLLSNAIAAIDEKGVITIRTWTDDTSVFVRISDTGRGIRSEKLKQIFDFNFKKGGRRVSVATGLSSSLHVVRIHGGDIDIDSTSGVGTSLTVRLPIEQVSCSTGGDS